MLLGVEASSAQQPTLAGSGRRLSDRLGDLALRALTGLAALGALVLIGLLVYKVVDGAWPAVDAFGLSFLTNQVWNPVTNQFGALAFIFGTVMTSLGALIVAAPVSIAIGLYLSELAPRSARGAIGTLVELLAAIPSVVLGL